MNHSIKENRNKLLSIRNRANQIEERIGDIGDKNLEMMQRKQVRTEHRKVKEL